MKMLVGAIVLLGLIFMGTLETSILERSYGSSHKVEFKRNKHTVEVCYVYLNPFKGLGEKEKEGYCEVVAVHNP
tara:strand:+ start:1022 stop:1243 length:222 start_codon:yes stop_codon:yes gene_type:complete